MSDVEIAQRLYADAQRTPPGFYQESTSTTYQATSHLKNTDLAGATTQFELCTDDWNTALAWSEQTANGATLTETNATQRYYEFVRTRAGTPTLSMRARVYRCAYLDRAGVDLRQPTSSAGVLNQRPLTADELRVLSEYLWQFTAFNNYGNAVLASRPDSAALAHSLIIATLTSNNSCDRIVVLEWKHSAGQSGALTLTQQTLWEFGARRNAGVVELCSPT